MSIPPLQPFSFLVGFITAIIFWTLVGRMRPLWGEIRAGWKRSREEAKARRSTTVEENHRRTTLRRAQGMHLAAPLFALDEIVEVPRLLAPAARREPGEPFLTEEITSRTIPYLPSWPELAAIYHAPSLSLALRLLKGEANLVLTGQPGTGKTVALAYLATMAANRDPQLGLLSESVPFLYHIADLRLPTDDTKDVLNPIQEAAAEHAPVMDLTRLPAFIQNAFESGRALLLLDGFDELPPGEQVKVTEYLKKLLKTYTGIRVVTTGCLEHLDGILSLGFEPLTLMPWNISQSNRFIEKWGQLWAQTVAAESWSQSGPEEVDPLLLKHLVEFRQPNSHTTRTNPQGLGRLCGRQPGFQYFGCHRNPYTPPGSQRNAARGS